MSEFFSIVSEPSVCKFLQILIIIPFLAGILLFLVPEKHLKLKGIFALVISLITGYLTLSLFTSAPQMVALEGVMGKTCNALFGSDLMYGAESFFTFSVDNLSKLIILFISLFSILVLIYSIVYIKSGRVKHYYQWFLITLGCSYGAVLADNLVMFLIFWGILGITLYKLIPGRDEESSATAKKTLILIGASDSIMIIGIGMIYRLTGSFSIGVSFPADRQHPFSDSLHRSSCGMFHQSRRFPFPFMGSGLCKRCSGYVFRIFPASLDKLLGIYFLARMTMDIFILNDAMRLIVADHRSNLNYHRQL